MRVSPSYLQRLIQNNRITTPNIVFYFRKIVDAGYSESEYWVLSRYAWRDTGTLFGHNKT